MRYKFHAYGHPNILATHKTTLEFTKDADLSLKGDCIAGVNADFDLEEIKKLIKNSRNKKIKFTIESEDKKISDVIVAELNESFDDKNEIVIRKADFVSRRTLAIRSNKAAFGLNKDLVRFLKVKGHKTNIVIESSE